jgi:hypothetical protein
MLSADGLEDIWYSGQMRCSCESAAARSGAAGRASRTQQACLGAAQRAAAQINRALAMRCVIQILIFEHIKVHTSETSDNTR